MRRQHPLVSMPVYSQGIAWFRLTDTLTPGSEAYAYRLRWDATNSQWAEIQSEELITDSWFSGAEDDDSHTNLGSVFVLKGEVIPCFPGPGNGKWVPACCGYGLRRLGKVDLGYSEDAELGEVVTVKIWVGDPTDFWVANRDTGQVAKDANNDDVSVEAWHEWISTRDTLDDDEQVIVEYFSDWFRWMIVDYDCGT